MILCLACHCSRKAQQQHDIRTFFFGTIGLTRRLEASAPRASHTHAATPMVHSHKGFASEHRTKSEQSRKNIRRSVAPRLTCRNGVWFQRCTQSISTSFSTKATDHWKLRVHMARRTGRPSRHDGTQGPANHFPNRQQPLLQLPLSPACWLLCPLQDGAIRGYYAGYEV